MRSLLLCLVLVAGCSTLFPSEPAHPVACKIVAAFVLIDSTKVPIKPDTLYKQYDTSFYCRVPD